jgi:multidrug efflux system membrane fusion protein
MSSFSPPEHSDTAPHAAALPTGRPSLRRARQIGVLAVLLLLGGAGTRAYVNAVHAASVARATEQQAVRTVLTTQAKPGQGLRTVALPATLRGENEAAIHARTNGYVRAWKKDIGDKVKRGDVLALIDTPEIDQELALSLIHI